jgi:hypothetical protein
MRLHKPTQLLRVTVDQQGRAAVDGQAYGDGDILRGVAADGHFRMVTILTPPSPIIQMSIDQPVEVAGANRTQYKWAPLPTNSRIPFCIGPEQTVYATAVQGGGLASFAVIVEFLEE